MPDRARLWRSAGSNHIRQKPQASPARCPVACRSRCQGAAGTDRCHRGRHAADLRTANHPPAGNRRMSLASAWSVAMIGLDGRIVEVEAHIGSGLPRTVMVGLVDTALYEARDRCKAAVTNSGHIWPQTLLTINLSPATLPKRGGHYDLAIVSAVLAAAGVFGGDGPAGSVLLGELGLDGRVRPVRGVLPATLAASQAGFRRVIVPLRQAAEAKLVEGIEVFGVASLGQLIALFRGDQIPEVEPADVVGEEPTPRTGSGQLDMADVVGQSEAKWATEV